jgi:hypothetical protein
MRLNLIERLSLELVCPLQPSLEQFHARLFAGGEVAERDDAISVLSHRYLSSRIFTQNQGILIPDSAEFELDFISLSIL